LTADHLIFPGFAEDPSDKAGESVRAGTLGVSLYFTPARDAAFSPDAVAAAGFVAVRLTGARGTAFSLEIVAASGGVT
jgi:hypothetical protein